CRPSWYCVTSTRWPRSSRTWLRPFNEIRNGPTPVAGAALAEKVAPSTSTTPKAPRILLPPVFRRNGRSRAAPLPLRLFRDVPQHAGRIRQVEHAQPPRLDGGRLAHDRGIFL